MRGYVLDLQDIDRSQASVAGGKGANLGELTRMTGIRVPPGFCVTTGAFRRVVAEAPVVRSGLEQLSRLHADDHSVIRAVCDGIRASIDPLALPDDLSRSISAAYAALGSDARVAVRSSATAEDLPNASFAGQQDTFLNISGVESVLRHIRRCWASLFTERAVTYRMRNGFDHGRVAMAVVVQQMVDADASGVVFTADPITGNRRITVIDAVRGIGEALVAGHVNPDMWRVRDDAVVESNPVSNHGAALTQVQVLRLAALCRRIQQHFGQPQDIEWCLADGDFQIVQSRPITTLFPVPSSGDSGNHVYVSVGHQQMMTDPLKPLGLSFWQMTTPRPMAEAGGRLFVDVTPMLASSASRAGLLDALGRSDPLIRDAIETVLDRGNFIPPPPEGGPAWTPPGGGSDAIPTDAAIPAALIEHVRQSLAALERAIATKSGVELLDFIESDMEE
ncbi:MAG TPA: PEP/pyruvate-binding domain-containing protein, partial [Longimicrobiales bacterium]